MAGAFDREVITFADGMGISLYQRFDLHEASLFLRIQQVDVEKLIKKNQISFIQVTKTEVQFFGFQLIEYLIKQTTQTKQQTTNSDSQPMQSSKEVTPAFAEERIIRFAEVKKLVGLSRTTIWRKQQKGDFPQSIPLGVNSVGWYKSEIDSWILQQRKNY